MIRFGKIFPKKDRSPFIIPIAEKKLQEQIELSSGLGRWSITFSQRVSSSFYQSQAMELTRR